MLWVNTLLKVWYMGLEEGSVSRENGVERAIGQC